jgi:hypothetical protein
MKKHSRADGSVGVKFGLSLIIIAAAVAATLVLIDTQKYAAQTTEVAPVVKSTAQTRTPRATLVMTANTIKGMVPPLTQSQANQLIAYANAGVTHIDQGKPQLACTDLKNFMSRVNVYVKGKSLTAAQADPLLVSANDIRQDLSCP